MKPLRDIGHWIGMGLSILLYFSAIIGVAILAMAGIYHFLFE